MSDAITIIFGIIALLAMVVSNIFFNRKNKEHIVFLSGAGATIASLLSIASSLFLNGFEFIRRLIAISDSSFVVFTPLFFVIIISGSVFAFFTLETETKKEYVLAVIGFYFSTIFHLNLV